MDVVFIGQLTIMQPTVVKVVQAMSLGREGLSRLYCIVLLTHRLVSPRLLYKYWKWLKKSGLPTNPKKYKYVTIGWTHLLPLSFVTPCDYTQIKMMVKAVSVFIPSPTLRRKI